MKALVVYDSAYGDTEDIARTIASALGSEARVLHVAGADLSTLGDVELLIVGSPTQGGRPTAAITQFLNEIPDGALRGARVAAFDTRFAQQSHGFGLRLLMGLIGFAAGRISKALQAKGGVLAAEPEGFIVQGKEGPLREGELERAMSWARQIVQSRE